MPQGIEAQIEDGFVTLTFSDPRTRGEALRKLIEIGGRNAVSVDTSGTRRSYTTLETFARRAGLLDEPDRDPVPAQKAARKAPAKKAARKAPAKKTDETANPFDAGGVTP